MNGPDPLNYGWWLASRSAGVVAVLCVGASVILGLLMANNLPRKPGAKARLRPLHESIALAGMVALAVHGVTLLGDPWLKPGLSGISLPFTSPYRPLFTGIGVIAGYGVFLLGLSFYARRQIGAQRWRSIHRFTVLAYGLALIHVLGAGTDSGQLWLRVVLLASAVPAAGLLAMRLLNDQRPPPRPTAPRSRPSVPRSRPSVPPPRPAAPRRASERRLPPYG